MTISYGTEVSTASTSRSLQDLVKKENEQSPAAAIMLKYLPSQVSFENLGRVLEESALEYSLSTNADFDSAHDYITDLLCEIGSPEIKEITKQILAHQKKIDQILEKINGYF